MRSNTLEIRPVGGAVGAEIAGVDLGEPLAAGFRDVIRQTLADRGVVFFRDQSLTPEQHIALARQFGDINVNRFFAHADGYPEIALVAKEPGQTKNIGAAGTPTTATTRSPRSVPCCMRGKSRRWGAIRCLPRCMPLMTRCRMG